MHEGNNGDLLNINKVSKHHFIEAAFDNNQEAVIHN
jgi:hypothetical protein